MTNETNRPVEIGQGDWTEAEKFRRGHGGKYDRDVSLFAAAFARHAASVREEGFRAGIAAAVADIETWFPANTLGRPEYAAAKTLRDSVARLSAERGIDGDVR